MSIYRQETKKMIRLLQGSGRSTNVLRDFFAQLSRIRPIDSIAVINALQPSNVDSGKLIVQSVTKRDWMQHISLGDIRTHVVFTIWKEHKLIISSKNYYDTAIDNELYKKCYKNTTDIPSLHVDEIGKLLETCFYISHICAIKELIEDDFDDLSIIETSEWDMYHIWLLTCIKDSNLKNTVYENFKLIEPLLQYQ